MREPVKFQCRIAIEDPETFTDIVEIGEALARFADAPEMLTLIAEALRASAAEVAQAAHREARRKNHYWGYTDDTCIRCGMQRRCETDDRRYYMPKGSKKWTLSKEVPSCERT